MNNMNVVVAEEGLEAERVKWLFMRRNHVSDVGSLWVSDFHATQSMTTSYGNKLSDKVNKNIQKYDLTDEQEEVIVKIVDKLSHIIPKANQPILSFDEGPENEALISFHSKTGLHMISIDEEGDIMISFSGYKFDDGWRKFVDYGEMDPETVTFDFLSSIS